MPSEKWDNQCYFKKMNCDILLVQLECLFKYLKDPICLNHWDNTRASWIMNWFILILLNNQIHFWGSNDKNKAALTTIEEAVEVAYRDRCRRRMMRWCQRWKTGKVVLTLSGRANLHNLCISCLNRDWCHVQNSARGTL